MHHDDDEQWISHDGWIARSKAHEGIIWRHARRWINRSETRGWEPRSIARESREWGGQNRRGGARACLLLSGSSPLLTRRGPEDFNTELLQLYPPIGKNEPGSSISNF